MKLCIPVTVPAGLDSLIERDFAHAEHLLCFDTETRSSTGIALHDKEPGAGSDVRIDAVLCASINRRTLLTLARQGIKVYYTDAQTVAQALGEYEEGRLQLAAMAPDGCAAHCHGADHQASACHSGNSACRSHAGSAPSEHHCGAAGGGCGGRDKAGKHEGGAGCGSQRSAQRATAERPPSDLIRIAVSSQNRKTVTEHAGKCRKFWMFDVIKGKIVAKTLIELASEQSFHAAIDGDAHPLDGIDILITSGIGSGLQQRLWERGIEALLTTKIDPDQAVAAYLAGRYYGFATLGSAADRPTDVCGQGLPSQ